MMTNERFDRQVRFFGRAGQEKLTSCHVVVAGVGGLGSHVVQQLAYLGVGRLTLVDSEELAVTDLNRNVLAQHDDPIPGTRKVDIGERAAGAINPEIVVQKIFDSLVSELAFDAVIRADCVFGCLDSEGARLVLNELCAAYERPYIDLSSDIVPGNPPAYGGQVCVAWDGHGCLVCWGLLDVTEAQADLAGPAAKKDREAIYGVDAEALDQIGPSVVSINGVIASLGVTEFLLSVTGIRPPKPVYTLYGHMGRLATPTAAPAADCYYCKGIRGKGDAVDVHRYVREGVGKYLR